MADQKSLTILQVNDVHGYAQEHWELFLEGHRTTFIRAGGYARMLGYIKSVQRETAGGMWLLDGGDTFHGTRPVVATKGEMSSWMNQSRKTMSLRS